MQTILFEFKSQFFEKFGNKYFEEVFFKKGQIFFQIQKAFDVNQLSSDVMLEIQVYLGASWILGCLSFGFIVILKPRGCQITKVYLCILSLSICGFCCFLANHVTGEAGHIVFVLVYGVFSSGFQYVFKMLIFDLSRSRNFPRTWPIFQFVQGLGVIISVPMMNNNFNGVFLVLAALVLVLGDRYKHYLRVQRRHKEHLDRYHNNDQNHCQQKQKQQQQPQQQDSIVIHHEECCYVNDDKHDDFDDDTDDEDSHIVQDSIMDMFKNRNTSAEAMQQWKQLEQELFHNNQNELQDIINAVEQTNVKNTNEQHLDLSAKPPDQRISVKPMTSRREPNNFQQSVKNRQLLVRQPSDEGCYTSSSSSGGHLTSSSGSSRSGLPGPKYKMSAALSQAMVTAAFPVARPTPAAIPGNTESKAIPELQAIPEIRTKPPNNMTGWQKQRSITVIEEVSA
jgi:hypothetical protein